LLVGEARGVAATLTLALLEDGTGALYPVPDLNRTTEDSYTTVTVCVLNVAKPGQVNKRVRTPAFRLHAAARN
jgi:hypothetical protein